MMCCATFSTYHTYTKILTACLDWRTCSCVTACFLYWARMNLTPCVLPSCSLLPEPEAAAVARSGCWRLCLSSDRRHRSCLAGEENCDMVILVTAISPLEN